MDDSNGQHEPDWQHEPPWRHGPPSWDPSHRPWMKGRRFNRRFFFFRVVLPFLALLTVFLGILLVLLVLALRPLESQFPSQLSLVLVACSVPLVLGFLALILGSLFLRRFALPAAELMDAADTIAQGDLSVRVRENIPGGFGRLARRFNRMTAELERSQQQRRSLTADVAHELRTPLHIIQGNLEGVLDGVYQPTSEHIGATLEETQILARLVDDLQTLSLAESGQLPLHKQHVSALDILEDTQVSFSGQAAAVGVDLRIVSGAPGDPLEIEADPDRLEQVLNNLVANALRYTPSGGSITLTAGRIGDAIRLEVADTGSGIPPEDLPFVFDRFWRGDRSRGRGQGAGSGLGLAIARQLVQSHGGEIRVESQPGEGTRFVIDLPGALM